MICFGLSLPVRLAYYLRMPSCLSMSHGAGVSRGTVGSMCECARGPGGRATCALVMAKVRAAVGAIRRSTVYTPGIVQHVRRVEPL